jgi:hypothetical protein
VAHQFVPEPALVEVQLTCRPSETPDNGLDDDCDGVIDGPRGTATQLTISAAHRSEARADVRLDLTDPAGGAVPNLAMERTSTRGSTVSSSRLDLSALPSGRYRLTAARGGPEAEPAELSLAVSLATKDKARTYLVRLGAGETRTLGVIEVR